MKDHETLLDIKEAARFLKVSETSLRRWTNSGRLACLRIGRRRERRFRRGDLLAFMEQQAPVAARPADHTMIGGLQVDLGAHLCGLCSTDDDRVRLAVSFLADGLAPDSICFVIGPSDVRAEILGGLEQRVPSLVQHIEEGRLVTADYAPSIAAQCDFFETRLTDAMAQGARSFRIVGDVAGFAERTGGRYVAEYEAAFSSAIAKRFPVVTLCVYDARYFSGVDVLDALRSHPDSFGHLQRVC
jgi:excisionase family DNA binding protein